MSDATIIDSRVEQIQQIWGLHNKKPNSQAQWDKDLKYAIDSVTLETVREVSGSIFEILPMSAYGGHVHGADIRPRLYLYYNLSKSEKKSPESLSFDSWPKVRVSNESSWSTDQPRIGRKSP